MSRERFEHVLAAYGADPERWPAAERAAVEAYAAEHPEAAALLAARETDALLDLAREPAVANPALASRILNAAPRRVVRPSGSDARARWALAACALLGVVAGYGGGAFAPSATPDDPDAVIVAAFEAAFGEAVWAGDEG